jgi:hypothetical protein
MPGMGNYIAGNRGMNNYGWGLYISADGSLSLPDEAATHKTAVGAVPFNAFSHLLIKKLGRAWHIKVNNAPVFSGAASVANGNSFQIGSYTLAAPGNTAFAGILDEIAIFARATTEAEDEALAKYGLEKRHTLADYGLATLWQEDYWGATSSVPNSTGFHDGRKVHHGNYLMYTGTAKVAGNPQVEWKYAFIYQWDAVAKKWTELPKDKNWEKYLDGVSNLTNDAPDNAFNAVFAKNLFAQMLSGDYANIRMELRVGSEGRKIIIDGKNRVVKSEDFVAKTTQTPGNGWIIRGDGSCEFNSAIFRGQLDGAGGTFSGELKAATGTFSGNLSAAGGSFKGELTANSIRVSGQHTVGEKVPDPQYSVWTDDTATLRLHPHVVAYDNQITATNCIRLSSYTMVTKQLRVAGKGQIRFRVRYKGICSIWRIKADGNTETVANLELKNNMSEATEWSDIITLSENINRFYLSVTDWPQGSSGSILMYNSIFEARSASDPGLFAMLSSPF